MFEHQPYQVRTLKGRYDLLALVNDNTDDYPFYIESSSLNINCPHSTSNYDILFAFPQDYLVKLSDLGDAEFLPQLDRLFQAEKITHKQDLPFTGGWFLFLGYELVNEIEPILNIKDYDQTLPVAFAARVPAAIIYNHQQDETHVVVESEFVSSYMDRMIADLNRLGDIRLDKTLQITDIQESQAEDYKQAVTKILTYIKEGDVFQVNLSRQWRSHVSPDLEAVDLFRRLRVTNPAPFSAIAHYKDSAIISSSPERLVRVTDNKIETRPIAGTRPRNRDSLKDKDLQTELITNKKERAEHIMLIDLERNDLGRICEYGSVRVDELMQIETYAHVHHIVSNIVGTLIPGTLPGQVIRAVFPGGTITGCPKVRCMEIICELERQPRGAYTGSLGYLNRNGNMDLNILIRTFTKQHQNLSFRAGAGIVADSDPVKELAETRSKAKGLLMALNEEIAVMHEA